MTGYFWINVCPECNVKLIIKYSDKPNGGLSMREECPVCEGSASAHAIAGDELPDSEIPFLRFMKGKSPTPDK